MPHDDDLVKAVRTLKKCADIQFRPVTKRDKHVPAGIGSRLEAVPKLVRKRPAE